MRPVTRTIILAASSSPSTLRTTLPIKTSARSSQYEGKSNPPSRDLYRVDPDVQRPRTVPNSLHHASIYPSIHKRRTHTPPLLPPQQAREQLKQLKQQQHHLNHQSQNADLGIPLESASLTCFLSPPLEPQLRMSPPGIALATQLKLPTTLARCEWPQLVLGSNST